MAQTTHNIVSSELDKATDNINKNTDKKTDKTTKNVQGSLFGDTTDIDEAFGDCTLADMVISISLEEDIKKLCDPEGIEDFIKSDTNFSDFKNKFEIKEQFLELLPSKLIPNRDCNGSPLSDVGTFDSVVFASGSSSGEFGSPACLQQLSFEEPPQRVKAITISNEDVSEHNIRAQISLVNTFDSTTCGTESGFEPGKTIFEENIIFDSMVHVPAGSKEIITGDLMLTLPPNENEQICVRTASDTAGVQSKIWITAQEVVPINVFNFKPATEQQFFEFDNFSPIDFSQTCQVIVNVQDSQGNPLEGIPVILLDPFISGKSGPENFILTDASGNADFGASMPSAFYVIDVNNPPPVGAPFSINPNFGQGFPDTFVDCSTDPFTITSVLPTFGGESFVGNDLFVTVEDSKTAIPIELVSLTLTGTDPLGNTIEFDTDFDGTPDGTEFQLTTNEFGEADFFPLPPGKFNLTVEKSGFTTKTVTVTISGDGGFFPKSISLSPLSSSLRPPTQN